MPLPRLVTALAAAVRLAFAAFALAAVSVLAAAPASAQLLIEIDKHSQTMTVSRDGALLHRWPVSTGTRRHDTPIGRYTPFRMEVDHFSREWDNAPMPHSIFFTKRGHAIHGTEHLDAIGRPASRGCVRLEPQNAKLLFEMVRREGMANVRIALRGDTPPANAPWLARRAAPQRAVQERAQTGFGPEPRFERQPMDQSRLEPMEPVAPGPRAFGPTPLPRPDLSRSAPGYIGPRDAERLPPPPSPFGPPPWERPAPEFEDAARTGYWLVRPDGSRVFVDRERAARPLPPPPPAVFGGQRPF
ncbi:MAG: L,D-transpeptidase [Alphaproteobacteria bacterium]|nr:L,D-transpeptidase [Alphaproteobacteria bacterium]